MRAAREAEDPDWVVRLYVLNSALLFTHEIDSAFWHEWELFRLPGGLAGFLAANFALIVAAQVGFRSVIAHGPRRRLWAALLALAGPFAAVVHAGFLAAGSTRFRTMASIGLLAAWLLTSIVQLGLIARDRERPRGLTSPV